MKDKGNSRGLWIALAIILGAFVICGVSALAGGLAGYVAGRRATRHISPMEGRFEFHVEPRDRLSPDRPLPRLPLPHSDLDSQSVALVVDVVEGSPAHRAGLRAGDIILALGNELFGELETLSERIAPHDPGDEIALRVLRGDRESTVEVRLGRHPDRDGDAPWLGLTYRMSPRIGLDPDLRHDSDDRDWPRGRRLPGREQDRD